MLAPEIQRDYCAILSEELVLATGCTEPIAVAYGAAKLREALGAVPERILAEVSGNILKNVKSVIVPNTGGMKGIRAAVAAGVVAGDADRGLQVITQVPQERRAAIAAYMEGTPIQVACADTTRMLDIRLTGWAGGHQAVTHIANNHTNLVHVERDGEVLLDKPVDDSPEAGLTDKSVLNLRDILAFADTVDLSLVAPLLDRQIQCNTAIAEEGLRRDWGANIGSTRLKCRGGGIQNEAAAWAAAGSDARMSGCEMPVVINSGSGNQGMTASLPVIRYAKAPGRRAGAALPGAAGEQPGHALPEGGDRPALGLLRGRQRRRGGRGRHRLPPGRRITRPWPTPSPTPWPSSPAPSATGPSPPARQRLPRRWTRASWDMRCTAAAGTSTAATASWEESLEETVANVGVLAREGMRGTDRTILQHHDPVKRHTLEERQRA